MRAPRLLTRNCIDCKTDYFIHPQSFGDALCLSCRARQDAADLARTHCPRCKNPMTPARFKLLCSDCATVDLIESIRVYGSG